MSELGLKSVIIKNFKHHTTKIKIENKDNVLSQYFTTTTINKRWAGDITYIHTLKDGWCYLASVMNLHANKIIVYTFDKSMTTDLIIRALDNVCIESFHTILNKEEVYRIKYFNFESTRLRLFEYVEGCTI